MSEVPLCRVLGGTRVGADGDESRVTYKGVATPLQGGRDLLNLTSL